MIVGLQLAFLPTDPAACCVGTCVLVCVFQRQRAVPLCPGVGEDGWYEGLRIHYSLGRERVCVLVTLRSSLIHNLISEVHH